jgi:hypothetical protein
MMRLSRTALLASALLLGARAAGAQTITSPYRYVDQTQSVGVILGYQWTDPDITLPDSSQVPVGAQSGPMVGLRYALRAAGPLTIEASVTVMPTERQLFGPEFSADSSEVVVEDLGVAVPATVVSLDLGGRFHLTGPRTWKGLAPFLAASAGMVADVRGTFDEEEDADLDSSERFRFGPSFAVGASLGTDWFASRSTSLRVELSGRLWSLETPSGFLFLRRTGQDEWNPVVGLSVGGAFHF